MRIVLVLHEPNPIHEGSFYFKYLRFSLPKLRYQIRFVEMNAIVLAKLHKVSVALSIGCKFCTYHELTYISYMISVNTTQYCFQSSSNHIIRIVQNLVGSAYSECGKTENVTQFSACSQCRFSCRSHQIMSSEQFSCNIQIYFVFWGSVNYDLRND